MKKAQSNKTNEEWTVFWSDITNDWKSKNWVARAQLIFFLFVLFIPAIIFILLLMPFHSSSMTLGSAVRMFVLSCIIVIGVVLFFSLR